MDKGCALASFIGGGHEVRTAMRAPSCLYTTTLVRSCANEIDDSDRQESTSGSAFGPCQ
jgi:hypothetical protein